MKANTGGSPTSMTESDVYSVYALALGRLPEAVSVVTSRVGGDRDESLRSFFATEEHRSNVLAPVAEGRRLAGGLFDQEPGEALCGWAASVLPLSTEAGDAVRASASSWHRLYAALFADSSFQAFVEEPLELTPKSLVPAFEKLAEVEGGVERLTPLGLKGWCLAPAGGEPRTVEARLAGQVVAVGLAGEFRRDIQDRFGGDGVAGYVLVLDERLLADPRGQVVEVRDRASDVYLGALTLTAQSIPLTVGRRLVQEVASVRRLLESIEAALPVVKSELALELENYSDWYATYVRPLWRPAAARSDAAARLLVTIDARGAPIAWVSDALESLEAQTIAEWAVVIVGDGPEIQNLATTTTWRSGRPVAVSTPEMAADPGGLEPGIEAVVRLTAHSVLEPDALETVLAVMRSDDAPAALFWDEDVLEALPTGPKPSTARRRVNPWFKAAFDLDLLLQEPALGSGVALSRAALAATGEGGWIDADASASGLALVEVGITPRHLPRVLQSRQRNLAPDPHRWAVAVQAYLDRTMPGARAVVEPDALGAPAGVRVEESAALTAVTATVIIPTRDRLDLLRPCIESLIEARASNAVAMDLLIVDHSSEEPEARAYIDSLEEAGVARVMPYEGAFNWALINNLAAAQSDADVLVFLNNDTVVITPDWLDRLCRQAIRPDVGAVGARLVYADGTIQHAGFIARSLPDSFLTPEGMGVAGADGGYLARHARLRRAAAVTGACMAVRSSVFRQVGGFDAANLPVDWNDIDLCLKVRAQGLTVLYEPAVVLYHFESRSRGMTQGGDRITASARAASLVLARWGDRFAEDGDYSVHFDRLSAPFARIGPVDHKAAEIGLGTSFPPVRAEGEQNMRLRPGSTKKVPDVKA